MSAIGVLRIAISLAVVFLLVKPLGAYMARVYEGRRTLLDPVLRPLERLLYRLCRIDPNED
ncbi:MAG TPA: potassium-transporting ATPase subunit KdpA, partial [bacterium]|nr:potassium-transporting ATPase subunit KdpA [bacterium]